MADPSSSSSSSAPSSTETQQGQRQHHQQQQEEEQVASATTTATSAANNDNKKNGSNNDKSSTRSEVTSAQTQKQEQPSPPQESKKRDLEAIKAEARAYALSGGSKKKRKTPGVVGSTLRAPVNAVTTFCTLPPMAAAAAATTTTTTAVTVVPYHHPIQQQQQQQPLQQQQPHPAAQQQQQLPKVTQYRTVVPSRSKAAREMSMTNHAALAASYPPPFLVQQQQQQHHYHAPRPQPILHFASAKAAAEAAEKAASSTVFTTTNQQLQLQPDLDPIVSYYNAEPTTMKTTTQATTMTTSGPKTIPPTVHVPLPPLANVNASATSNREKELAEWDDYERFVQSLLLDDTADDDAFQLLFKDDDEDFCLEEPGNEDDEEDEEEEDDDDNDDYEEEEELEHDEEKMDDKEKQANDTSQKSGAQKTTATSFPPSSPLNNVQPFDFPELGPNFYEELEEELGWLEEEDMEAAVATLLDHPRPEATTAAITAQGGDASETAVTQPADKESAAAMSKAAAAAAAANTTTTSAQPSKPATDDTIDGSDIDTEQPFKRNLASAAAAAAATTTQRETRSGGFRIEVTDAQYEALQGLLSKHYQLLLQQAVLAARAAHHQRLSRQHSLNVIRRSYLIETVDELVEILDGSVGMLQDLDQNRRDAIRHLIQFAEEEQGDAVGQVENMEQQQQQRQESNSNRESIREASSSKRCLFASSTENSNSNDQHKRQQQQQQPSSNSNNATTERRLTRSQFFKTLQSQGGRRRKSIFEVAGLDRLHETFSKIDKSVEGIRPDGKDESNILVLDSNKDACQQVLNDSGAVYDETFLPGARDVSENFVDPKEVLGKDFKPPCTEDQETMLRRHRNLFTSGEDNLVLRGVNTYGEKQFALISDRFLPDRSMNIISQRYNKLCVMLYKANGIAIDEEGRFEKPPKFESVDDVDESKAKTLKKVVPPAILNVHRWSLEEDLTILKAVPIFGTMWAEIAARFLEHRDRGHIRKRYLVLERRVKATVTKEKKHEEVQKHTALQKQQEEEERQKAESVKASENEKAIALSDVQNRPSQTAAPKSQTQNGNQPTHKANATRDVSPAHKASAPAASTAPHAAGAATGATATTGPFSTTPHRPYPQRDTAPYSPHPYYMHPYYAPPPEYVHLPHQYQSVPPPHHYPPPPMSPPLRMDHSVLSGARALAEEGSRAAFERLVQESNNELSKISTIQRTAEEDEEEEAATTIVRQLARGGVDGPPQHSNNLLGDLDSDNGEFSMLDSYRPSPGRRKTKPSEGLLAGVLKKADERMARRASDRGVSDGSNGLRGAPKESTATGLDSLSSVAAMRMMPPPPKGTEGSRKREAPGDEYPSMLDRPTKKRKTAASAPQTPGRRPSNPQLGTPTQFSPAFKSVFSPENALKSPSMTLMSLPGGDVSHLSQNGGHIMDGYDLNGVFDHSQNSRTSADGAIQAPYDLEGPQTPSPSKESPYSSTPLFGEGRTLMEHDLEAISALNSLSSSPAVVGTSSSTESATRSKSGSAASSPAKGKSLFARVVGKAGAPPKGKRRLQF